MTVQMPPESNCYLLENITEDTLADVTCFLLKAPGPEIYIYIDSGGGCFTTGLALYEAIRQHPFPVTVHAQDEVHSAAMLVYLAGKRRTANPYANFLIHEVCFTVDEEGRETAASLRQKADSIEKDTKTFFQLIARESGLSVMTIRKNVDANAGEWHFGAKQALKHKIVHDICHPFPKQTPVLVPTLEPSDRGHARGRTAAAKRKR